MNEKELRIGNYVVDTFYNLMDGHTPPKITIIELQDFVAMLNYKKSLHPNTYIPIKLTEKWLFDFGFKRYESERDDDGVAVIYYNKPKSTQLTIVDFGNGFIMSNAFSLDNRIELKTVHQLQNLFFALTNEELKIKP